jgi:hypothetical protein
MRRFCFCLLLIALVCGTAFAVPSTRTTSTKRVSAKQPVRQESHIEAIVTSVTREKFPNVQLTLRVTRSSNVSLLKSEQWNTKALVASPLYIKGSKGTYEWNIQNIQNLGAFYLLSGDRITAKVTSPRVDATNQVWYLTEIQRKSEVALENPNPQDADLKITPSKKTAHRGEPITFTLLVANNTKEMMVYNFSSSKQYDFSDRCFRQDSLGLEFQDDVHDGVYFVCAPSREKPRV